MGTFITKILRISNPVDLLTANPTQLQKKGNQMKSLLTNYVFAEIARRG